MAGEAALENVFLWGEGRKSLVFGQLQCVRLFSSSFPKSTEPGKESQKDKLLMKVGSVCLIQPRQQRAGERKACARVL